MKAEFHVRHLFMSAIHAYSKGLPVLKGEAFGSLIPLYDSCLAFMHSVET